VAGVAGLGWLVVYLPQLQTALLSQKIKSYETSPQPDPKELAMLEKGRIDTENAIRAALIQGLGGMAVLIGAYFAGVAERGYESVWNRHIPKFEVVK